MMELDKLTKRFQDFVDAIEYAIRNRTAPDSELLEGKSISEIRDETMSQVADAYYDKEETDDLLNDRLRDSEDSHWTIMGYTPFEPSHHSIEGIFETGEKISLIIPVDDQRTLLFGENGALAITEDEFDNFTGHDTPFSGKPISGAYYDELYVVGTDEGELYQSSDNGESWQEVDLSITDDDEFSFDEPIVFIGVDSQNRWVVASEKQLIRSSPDGWDDLTLEAESLDLPPDTDGLNGAAIDSDDVIYLAADSGLYYELDDGDWHFVDTGLGNNVMMVAFSEHNSTIATDNSPRVAVKRDSDSEWVTSDINETIVEACSNSEGLWIGRGEDGRLYRSLDDGYRWRRLLRDYKCFAVIRAYDRWVVGRTEGDYMLSK